MFKIKIRATRHPHLFKSKIRAPRPVLTDRFDEVRLGPTPSSLSRDTRLLHRWNINNPTQANGRLEWATPRSAKNLFLTGLIAHPPFANSAKDGAS